MQQPHNRARDVLELSGVLLFVCFAVWIAGPRLESWGLAPVMRVAYPLFLLHVAVLSPMWHGDTLSCRGLGSPRTLFVRCDNLRQGAKKFGMVLVVVALLLLLWVLLAGRAEPAKVRLSHLVAHPERQFLYFASALWQDLFFVGFLCVRVAALFGVVPGGDSDLRSRGSVSLVVGGLFFLYHLPNMPLASACMVLGAALVFIFLRTPNLVCVVVSHSLAGGMLYASTWIQSMRIGPFFHNPDGAIFRVLFPWISSITTYAQRGV